MKELPSKEGIRSVWASMHKRCRHVNAYKNCTVYDEWLEFEPFYLWYCENYYTVDGDTIHLDKDIKALSKFKHREPKIYSPDTCLLVPARLNRLFINENFYDHSPIRQEYVKYIEEMVRKASRPVKLSPNFHCDYYKEFRARYILSILYDYEDLPDYVEYYIQLCASGGLPYKWFWSQDIYGNKLSGRIT